MTNITDQKPQQYYYTQFLIDKFICHQKQIQGTSDANQQEFIQ